eukprot:scaffold20942_cov94-Skeletonema_dohrnii-CCMP3373.AAC.2
MTMTLVRVPSRCVMSSVKRRVEEDLLLQLRDLEAPPQTNTCLRRSTSANSRTVVEAVRPESRGINSLLYSLVVWVERWLGQPMHVGPSHRELLAAIAETNPTCEIYLATETVKPQLVHMM